MICKFTFDQLSLMWRHEEFAGLCTGYNSVRLHEALHPSGRNVTAYEISGSRLDYSGVVLLICRLMYYTEGKTMKQMFVDFYPDLAKTSEF